LLLFFQKKKNLPFLKKKKQKDFYSFRSLRKCRANIAGKAIPTGPITHSQRLPPTLQQRTNKSLFASFSSEKEELPSDRPTRSPQ
jgi:hypothetical protein